MAVSVEPCDGVAEYVGVGEAVPVRDCVDVTEAVAVEVGVKLPDWVSVVDNVRVDVLDAVYVEDAEAESEVEGE